MNRSIKRSTFRSTSRNFSKKKSTKIYIDSIKKPTINKEEEKKIQENKNYMSVKIEEPILNEKDRKDKIIHETNLQVMDLLQKDLDKIEKENELILEEMNRLKEEEKELLEKFEQIRNDIETEKDELEELKDKNDEKTREYSRLMHLRHQGIMNTSNNIERSNNNNRNSNTNTGERQNQGNFMGQFTLGDVMDGILRISRMRRGNQNEEGGIQISPFDAYDNDEDSEEGSPMTYTQLQELPSSYYARVNFNNEKCNICGFEFCINDLVTKLVKCSHSFHKNCLVNRLSTRQSSKCPTCKVSII